MRSNIKELMQQEYGRPYLDQMLKMIAKNHQMFDDLWALFREGEDEYARYAMWVISHAVENDTELILPYLHEFPELLPKVKHDGERRGLLKILTLVPIPEDQYGFLLEQCFEWTNDSQQAVGIRILSITILEEISKAYPEIAGELQASIQNNWHRSSPGFQNRGGKILNRLRKRGLI